MNKWPSEDEPKVTIWNFLVVVFVVLVAVVAILAVVAPYAG
jgi:hypothetical protein